MSIELRLFEDTPFASTEMEMAAGTARAIYISAGQATINGTVLPTDAGIVSTDSLSIRVGDEGATLWRWEVVAATAPIRLFDERGALRLAAAINGNQISDSLLMRLDSVAFPPGGCAFHHTHQGPGIRCLREGMIRIDTEGRSASYGPGGAWFEAGPEPVFAQADQEKPSRFIRAMVLPRALMGASSIHYVNEIDRAKPKSQTYRVWAEAPIELPTAV
ncbi:MAG: hypothetical protein HQ502_02670 [Alphaproteobacteria bacterium]|nr:hypothetical protein [Alphaproteobacteria bacterium]